MTLTLRTAGDSTRPLAARWSFSADLELLTPARFGTEAYGATDMPVLVTKDGRPLLTGATLAGALRSHLTDRLSGYWSPRSHPNVALLFGAQRADPAGGQSLLVCHDAPGTAPASLGRRNGIRVRPADRQVDDGALFDFEVLAAGTTFPLHVELLVPADTANSRPGRRRPLPSGRQAYIEAVLLGLVDGALGGLRPGDIALGGGTSRGMGELRAGRWRAERHDLTVPTGWVSWATSDHRPTDAGDGHACLADAVTAAGSPTPRTMLDWRSRVRIDIRLDVRATLIVREPSVDTDTADVAHLRGSRAGGEPLPGTGTAGALRAAAGRVAATVGDTTVADGLVGHLFGSDPSATRAGGTGATASRLTVSESSITGSVRVEETRIALNRFTSGVLNGALLQEQVLVGGDTIVRLDLRRPRRHTDLDAAAPGLLLLAVKDLLDGMVPLGGEVGIGRGEVTGRAHVEVITPAETPITGELTTTGARGGLLGEWVDAQLAGLAQFATPDSDRQ